MKKSTSLRKKLILLISLPILITALLIGTLSWMGAYEEIDEVYDAQLAHAAKVLLQLTEHEVAEHKSYEIALGAERNDLAHRYEKKLTFRIWKDDHLVTQSVLAKDFGSFRAPHGYSEQKLKNEDWRFFVLFDPSTRITIEVAEKEEVRQELILKILAGFLAPLSLFFPLVIVLIWWGVTRSLSGLIKLSDEVNLREVDDFSPIGGQLVPEEIQPLIRAFNKLLERMKETLSREQSFTDNAAHELRTPLAAMKTQTQVLLKKIKQPEYQDDLKNLHISIDRTAHMVDQLLSLARLQSGQEETIQDINLSLLLERVISEAAPLIQKRQLKIQSKIDKALTLTGHSQALELMFRNLLDNAVKYSPESGTVLVTLHRKDEGIVFELSDSGLGIPDTEKDRVFERFYRTQKNNASGSGLGLAIVRWVCTSHEAKIELLDNEPQGLRVKVSFSKEKMVS